MEWVGASVVQRRWPQDVRTLKPDWYTSGKSADQLGPRKVIILIAEHFLVACLERSPEPTRPREVELVVNTKHNTL